MSSTTTLRSDSARTATNPAFPINGSPWRKYLSVDLGTTMIGGTSVHRSARAGVLVVENWLFNAGSHSGEKHTLVLAATTTNEVYCFSEGSLLADPSSPTPLWHTSLGKTPMMRATSNIEPPIGICGTPVVDVANRRMFVVATWDDGTGTGKYSIFNLSLDTGAITASHELSDAGAAGRPTFDGDAQDQRTAINLVNGWLWFGFADYQFYDRGTYFGWVVAVDANDLSKQLYQPMIAGTSYTAGVLGGGIWGPGGVAAAADGSVYALTGNGPGADAAYWTAHGGAGPGQAGGYFNALVRLGVTISGTTPSVGVLDWFQDSGRTRQENDADLDFGGSSPLVLPEIDGRQLVAFVPKDGDVFVLDAASLGNWTPPLARETFGNKLVNGGDDTKAAIAFFQTPDNRNILIASADSTGADGGIAAFEVDATATPPTMTRLWRTAPLRDSFGSPIVIANPVHDPLHPPSPVALVWIIDGDPNGNYLNNCAMRAYDALTGTVVYDSTTHNDVTEDVPHFAPITSGGNSVFVGTKAGFIGLTQFPVVTKSLRFIIDRSTFGKDEVDSLEPTSTSVAEFSPAYWIAVDGVLPTDLGLTSSNLGSPPQLPTVTKTLDPGLSAAEATAIQSMLDAAHFAGPVIPENAALPDEPQGFLFPYAVRFTGDDGFRQLVTASHDTTLVTLQASLVGLSNSAQIELTTGANPYFLNVNPANPTQYPSWLSFDLRLFKVTENSLRFGAHMSGNPGDAPGFIAQVIANLNGGGGAVGADSFEGLTQDAGGSAIEFNPTDSHGHKVFNFTLARVRLRSATAGPTPFPVRVFFRLFQAQNTVSDFDETTTYRFASDGAPHGRKIPLLGLQNDQHGNPEYVTIPCFASPRINLTGPADMKAQTDPPNAYQITTITPGAEIDKFFGCWLDINQPQQKFLPIAPPAGESPDGPWANEWAANNVHSIQEAIIAAPHQCLIAEIRYDAAPVIPHANSSTSDKLAQRNIAWLDGPNPGVAASRRVTHPVQIKPTPFGSTQPDELMILSPRTPRSSDAELYVPGLNARDIAAAAHELYPAQQLRVVDEHTVAFETGGATFLPLPAGRALAAGLLTVTLPPGVRQGEQFSVTVRQLTEAGRKHTIGGNGPVPRDLATRAKKSKKGAAAEAAVAATSAATAHGRGSWRRVNGEFEFAIDISTKHTLLLKEERLLATLRWMAAAMPTERRWYPVLQRYIDYVIGRVRGFGGDPAKIEPSPTGWVHGLPKPRTGEDEDGDRRDGVRGKIEGLIYDHFGDFEGFVLESQEGRQRRFWSRKRGIEEVAKAARIERHEVAVEVEDDDKDEVRRLTVF
jgi:hypothetical protein